MKVYCEWCNKREAIWLIKRRHFDNISKYLVEDDTKPVKICGPCFTNCIMLSHESRYFKITPLDRET